MTDRQRLPNRREQFTDTITVGNLTFDASVGFDPVTGQPSEIFLAGAKDGTDMASILADTSVIVSIALQSGIPASKLARSVSRLPDGVDEALIRPASVIGAALDLLVHYETEEWR